MTKGRKLGKQGGGDKFERAHAGTDCLRRRNRDSQVSIVCLCEVPKIHH